MTVQRKPRQRDCTDSLPSCFGQWVWYILAFTLLCGLATILIGALLVKPAIYGQKFSGHTTCTVVSSSIGSRKECSCGKKCTSGFKCATIYVQYTTTDGNSYTNILLYENEGILLDWPQCSTETCKSSETTNDEVITAFVGKYGSTGDVHNCQYNIEDQGKVILGNKYGELAISLGLALPIIITVVSAILTVICFVVGRNHIQKHCIRKAKRGRRRRRNRRRVRVATINFEGKQREDEEGEEEECEDDDDDDDGDDDGPDDEEGGDDAPDNTE